MLRPTCPTCGKSEEIAEMREWPYFPFCSHKCRLIDLGRWIDGTYVDKVPVEEPEPEEDDEEGS